YGPLFPIASNDHITLHQRYSFFAFNHAGHRLALQGVLTSRLALGGGPASEIGVSPAFACWASTTRGCCSLLSFP
ncbi:TPA: hypothetical protein ACL1SE_004862, partial [Pseudomonas aeruginosa]